MGKSNFDVWVQFQERDLCGIPEARQTGYLYMSRRLNAAQKEYLITNKYMKVYPASLVIKKMQIKTTKWYHYTLTEFLKREKNELQTLAKMQSN